MVWLGKVIKTDPTQIILACIIGYITDVGHLTFPLPVSEKLPVHTNPFSGFVLLKQQPRLNEMHVLPCFVPLRPRQQRCVSSSAFAQSQDDNVHPAASAFSEEIIERENCKALEIQR